MLFRFIARLGLDVTDFTIGAKKATATANKMKSDMKSSVGSMSGYLSAVGDAVAAAFSISMMNAYIGKVSATVSEIKDMSELLSLSTEETQRLQAAANGASQSFSSIVKAFQSVEQARAKAMAGDKSTSLMFQILGIDPSKGNASDIISAALAASSKGVQENAAAFDLLGTKVQGVKLTFDELAKNKPIKLFSEEDIEGIDEAGKRLKEAIHQMEVASVPFVTAAVNMMAASVNLLNPKRFDELAGYNADQGSLPDHKKRTRLEQFHIGLLRGIQNPSLLGNSITEVASRAMGLDMSTQDRFEAMPIPEAKLRKAPDAYDPYFQFLKTTADSAKRTADILERTTTQ